jgi:hypothetical protein
MINTLVLLAILVLGCLALDIVILIITMQLMVRIDDVVPQMVVPASMQVKEAGFPLPLTSLLMTS